MTDIMKTKIVNTPICVGKICNFCGKEDREQFPSGGDMVIECAYGSIFDTQFRFWVCDECIKKLFYGKENITNLIRE
jgi:hypothetical protein